MMFLLIFLYGLMWGSFLNMLAYRLTFDYSLLIARSFCPSCNVTIAWYDNVPVVSYVLLGGRGRCCKKTISLLYPSIELLTGLLLIFLWLKMSLLGTMHYFWGYLIPFSALIISVRTDLEAMVIPQLCTLYLVPFGIIAAWFHWLPITVFESLFGACLGYGVLWLVAKLFQKCTGKEGLGIGDMELLALIGACFGPSGAWYAITFGSFVGLIFGGLYLMCTRKESTTPLPFGPALIAGLLIYFFVMM